MNILEALKEGPVIRLFSLTPEIITHIEKLEAQLKEANRVVEDFVMENDHAPFCPGTHFDKTMAEYNECKCMDRNYYDLDLCRERARAYQEKYKLS